jgi:hypothetical protein
VADPEGAALGVDLGATGRSEPALADGGRSIDASEVGRVDDAGVRRQPTIVTAVAKVTVHTISPRRSWRIESGDRTVGGFDIGLEAYYLGWLAQIVVVAGWSRSPVAGCRTSDPTLVVLEGG